MTNSTTEFRDGDILLRGGGAGSSPIERVSGGEFSHAGICGDANRSVAVDAYPGRDPYAVAETPLGDFFDVVHHPEFRVGGIYRYIFGENGESIAAAQYALQQVKLPYYFSLVSPILGEDGTILDDEYLYCSEFVWRCYRFGAEIQLVDPEEFFDVAASENVKRTAQVSLSERKGDKAGNVAERVPGVSSIAVNFILSKHNHNGILITPQQIADSSKLKCVGRLP